MPDWSYRPLLRAALFRLPPDRASALTLGLLGALGRQPWGRRLLDQVGRLRPPPSLARQHLGLTFRAPVGLGAGLDLAGRALAGLETFGLGFIEVGPVTWTAQRGGTAERRVAAETLVSPQRLESAGVATVRANLAQARTVGVPRLVRLAHAPDAPLSAAADEQVALVGALRDLVDAFTLDLADDLLTRAARAPLSAQLARLAACAAPRPVLLALPFELPEDAFEPLVEVARAAGLAGVVLRDAGRDGAAWVAGPGHLERIRTRVAWTRARLPPPFVVVAGGVHAPRDAVALLTAGADLVSARAAFVFHGPGFAHRVHEALALSAPVSSRAPSTAAPWGWPWMAALGGGLALSGALAGAVGLTAVVLPYDEAFVGLTRGQLSQVNPQLLAFLTHDRVTFAGTVLSIGVMYVGLALGPLRRGDAWAWDALWASAGVGFASFFLFLGYGYFDPLHAAVAGALLLLFALGLRGRPRAEGTGQVPDLDNDAAWRSGLAGQLLFVATGTGLILAGLTISFVGVTSVFVPQDLAFLRATAAALHAANPHLVALVAHDRAGFGGALASDGVAVLLAALWGYRRGARWLWWTLFAAGTPGFAATVWVHHHVAYTDAGHLAPAFFGLALYLAALERSFRFLHAR